MTPYDNARRTRSSGRPHHGDSNRPPRVYLRGGPPAHPLVYSKRVDGVEPGVQDGDVVQVCTREREPFGFGFYHSSSQIAVRMLTRRPDAAPNGDWLRRSIKHAHLLRTDTLRIPSMSNAWRSVHAEADGLSGLIVDRYDNVAVASLFSLGWFKRWDSLEQALRESLNVDRVVMRVDARTETHEGFRAPEQAPLKPFEIDEHGLKFSVDVLGGHKTGFFLDQRDNRRLIHGLAEGRRVLDGMTYTGGFALAAAQGGAKHVRGIDLDEQAIATARKNAKRNKLAAEFQHADVFNVLRSTVKLPDHERPDLLIVDPAKWAKNRDALPLARQRYFDLNRLAFRTVAPGGIVMTHSCSGLISEDDFLQILRNAAIDTHLDVRVLGVYGASPDHPVSLRAPETRYLKSVLCVVDPVS